jgi:UDP-2,3-diacylglucosamine hydrolase
MKKTYFLSDIHFGLQDKNHERLKEARFFSFLDQTAPDARAYYILGDLFDYWFDYKYVIPKGFHRILTRLEDITGRGIDINLIVGNHDFWVGKRFVEETGILVYFDHLTLTLNGKRFFLHHGDGLNDADRGYRFMRAILRNRTNIFLYRLLHPDLGIGLARKSSKTSRSRSMNGHESERSALQLFARKKLNEEYDYVIMGHIHHPEQIQIENRLYINLGDWIKHNTYAIYDETGLQLHTWNINEVSR